MEERTEVLHIISHCAAIRSTSIKRKTILVCSRDPGSANALLPVLTLLHDQVDIYCLVDSFARDIFLQHFATASLRVPQSILYADAVIPPPAVVLVDPSSSNRGLEDYAELHFRAAPLVLLEDYYGTANLALAEFARLHVTPAAICVMDQLAADIVRTKYPALAERITVTGQPAFDAIATENTPKLRLATRQALGVSETDQVVTFFSSAHDTAVLVENLTKQIQQLNNPKIKLIVRWHPRTNFSGENFTQFSTSELSAASDVVLTTTSVEGLHAIYRRKPVVYCYDAAYVSPRLDLVPPPPVALGAAFGVQTLSELPKKLSQALSASTHKNSNWHQAMQQHYCLDGNNAKRVIAVIKALLER